MKLNKYIKHTAWTLVAAIMLFSCDPQEDPKPNIGEMPTAEDVSFDFQYDAENPNIVNFTNTSPGFKFIWDLGNGQVREGNTVRGEYPLQGEYMVKLTILTRSGQASNSRMVNIAETNPLMLDDPDLNLITGGVDALGGKTWVIDQEFAGHMGVGPSGGTTPEWWQAAPGDKAGTGLYDDEYTFDLDGLAFRHETNGKVFLSGAQGNVFPGSEPAPGGDLMANYTAPTGQRFSFSREEDGRRFITLSSGAFIGFFTGVTRYEILELDENTMHIRFLDASSGDLAWYHRLKRKGYERPVNPPPYLEVDLHDNFEGSGNITWLSDMGSGVFNTSYDNPDPRGINTSDKVGRYVRADYQWSNIATELDHKMDLRNRNVFKLKVYLPGYNDYDTEDPAAAEWMPYKNLQRTVTMKLQNKELGGNAWETQVEIIKSVSEEFQWVEVEFDFSAAAEREDLDKIVIQLGGEGHIRTGTFFIDDFILLP
ncbi:MAG: hypothetical protein ACFCUU_01585 [Cyclobacteriaceae bacterium]